MKIKVIKTRKIVESWIEKNGKIIEEFPIKETEHTEKEIEQENFRISFMDGTDVDVLLLGSKIASCYSCNKEKRIISLMRYSRDGIARDGLDNLNFCLECSFREIEKKEKFSLKNPEVLSEIKEAINYKEKLYNQELKEKFIHEKS